MLGRREGFLRRQQEHFGILQRALLLGGNDDVLAAIDRGRPGNSAEQRILRIERRTMLFLDRGSDIHRHQSGRPGENLGEDQVHLGQPAPAVAARVDDQALRVPVRGEELAHFGDRRLVAGEAVEGDVGDARREPAGLGNVVRARRTAVRSLRLAALLGRRDAQPQVPVLVNCLEVGGHLLREGRRVGEVGIFPSREVGAEHFGIGLALVGEDEILFEGSGKVGHRLLRIGLVESRAGRLGGGSRNRRCLCEKRSRRERGSGHDQGSQLHGDTRYCVTHVIQ